jgi:ribA/ribD-fused uncharacterized protein
MNDILIENTKGKYIITNGIYTTLEQDKVIDDIILFLLSSKTEYILEGKAGVGKTTILKIVIREILKIKKLNILGTAISHQAKKVLANSVKNIPTSTIASALGIKLNEETGDFEIDYSIRGKQNKTPIRQFNVIIVDECSMISSEIKNEILNCIKTNTKVIYMGDHHQLPPIGENEGQSPTFDIENKSILKTRMRQLEDSNIVKISDIIADNIDSNDVILNPILLKNRRNTSDVNYLYNIGDAFKIYVEKIKNAPLTDKFLYKIITYNNHLNDNKLSVKNINLKIKDILHPNSDKIYHIGDILIAYSSYDPKGLDNLKGNDPLIINSENFIIKDIKKIEKDITCNVFSNLKGQRSFNIKVNVLLLELYNVDGEIINKIPVISEDSIEKWNSTLQILWSKDRQMAYALTEKVADFQHGYALTSHKAQGSTYKDVFIMEDNILNKININPNITKNKALYTAITRPNTKLYIISEKNISVLDIDYLKEEEVIQYDCIKFTRKDSKSQVSCYEELSNFFILETPIIDKEGNKYPSVEHFYQAKKSDNPLNWEIFTDKYNISAYQAKKEGKKLILRENWNEYIKYEVMNEGLRQKFNIKKYRDILLSTGNSQLIEWTWWNDTCWGMYDKTNKGANALGKLLQLRRKILKTL